MLGSNAIADFEFPTDFYPFEFHFFFRPAHRQSRVAGCKVTSVGALQNVRGTLPSGASFILLRLHLEVAARAEQDL